MSEIPVESRSGKPTVGKAVREQQINVKAITQMMGLRSAHQVHKTFKVHR